MYKHLKTPDLIPEIQQMLIDKKHMHLTKQEVYNLLKIHFGNVRRVLNKEDAIWWFGRYKILPNIQFIMERLVHVSNWRNKKYITIKKEYDGNTNGRDSTSPI